MHTRNKTRKINVNGVQIGGQDKVVIQSMTNTKTKDVAETVKQITQLEEAGCEIIRVACLDIEDAKVIQQIKEQIHIPIVADIHFDYKIALQAIESGVDKIRINPGNIGSKEKVKAVVDKCKEKGIPIRIGVNAGSLEKDLLEKNGGKPCAEAMVESARRHIEILEDLDFYDICLSLKASDLELCIKAYELASEKFEYPLHIGITEAGTAFSGTIKSSIGLGALLRKGIGDTLRVSLSDNPIEEIKVAKEILKNCGLYHKSPTLVSCPTCGRTQIDLIPMAKQVEDFLQTIEADITVAVMGCAVNGPGEARNADIGIAGGIKEGLLFKKGEIIKKVKQEEIVDVLKQEILEMIKRSTDMKKEVQIIIGKTAGFCYGVENAVTKTKRILEEKDNKDTVYCLGELVHNRQVVETLEKSELKVIENVEDLKITEKYNKESKTKVIIRAHGISPKTYQQLNEKKCEIVDLTCPNVLAIHKIAEEFSKQGFYTFLIGKRKHPETIGTYGFCENATIIEEQGDIDIAIANLEKAKKDKLLIIVQTTFSLAKFNELIEEIKNKLNEEKWQNENNIIIKNTICNATKLRQEETEKISKEVDYMIIVGGKNSSNTRKLYEIAKINCKNAFCVETAQELPIEEIEKAIQEKEQFKIGIMAGASTPKDSIEEIEKRLYY